MIMSEITEKPQIGVSACLLGHAVRFDGGHKRNSFVEEALGRFVDLHSVCPEAELGLGIPRPAIQLRKFQQEIRLVYSRTPEKDLTEDMQQFSRQRIEQLHSLDGFVFKKDSPSCGVFKVAVVDDCSGQKQRNGEGVFAGEFRRKYPTVPVEEEGRLNDDALRENFMERVYAHFRWRQFMASDNPLKGFRTFHRNYKLMLMAKNTQQYRQLGALAAKVNRHNFDELSSQYLEKFMQVMASVASRGQHINVLMHIMGYLKKWVRPEDKAEMLRWFEHYRSRQVDRVTATVLLLHHFRNYPDDYIAQQYYLSPYPAELQRQE